MRLSDAIEKFIKTMLTQDEQEVELKRNELAQYFNCAPSQINYVLATRFTPDHGYIIESRRGGGGSISIRRFNIDCANDYLMHIISAIGESLSQHTCEVFINNFVDYDIIDIREASLMRAALSDKAMVEVPMEKRDLVRASMLKNMMMSLTVGQ